MGSTSPNRDTSRAWAYHDATKHSEWSIRATPHYLDWANQPTPLKIYPTLNPFSLPQDAEQTGISALSAISTTTETPTSGMKIPTLKDLARILFFSAGITKRKTFPGGQIYFRAASCTGALYEFELYVVCGDLPDLKAGVYHFGPGDFALRLLRPGDYRSVIAHATADQTDITHAPISIICTGTYWRNAWKYRARSYRHFGWDNGTILANMLAMNAALRLPSTVVLGFVDSEINQLLGLDSTREVAFSLVSIGRADRVPAFEGREIPKLDLPTVPVSQNEVHYPELADIHAASSLQSVSETHEWRTKAEALTPTESPVFEAVDISNTDTIEQVILRRGSSRNFARQSISSEQLLTILRASTRGVWPGFALLNDFYIIINAVDGFAPGAYFYRRDTAELECLKEGDFRGEARHLGLQQDLPGDAAADVFMLADLRSILDRFGNRGYRVVQLEAGILGGKMYLAAYAQHLGATGLTFFDDDVTKFFSPHSDGKSAIFLMALGKSRKTG